MKIAPSLLAADFLNLQKDIQKVSTADYLHIDVMDGTFVPNISFGFSVIEPLSKTDTPELDVHLMTVNPQNWFKRLSELGIRMISFHYETALENTAAYIDQLHSLGCKAGVAVNPDVPVDSLYPYIGKADFFLVMSVFAGFGGQKFIPETIERISALRSKIDELGAGTFIQVDGGVGLSNISALQKCGADIAVAGSAVFKTDDPSAAIAALREA